MGINNSAEPTSAHQTQLLCYRNGLRTNFLMKLSKQGLAQINSISHDGKVLLFGTDNDGVVWYTVMQSGFEDSVFSETGSTSNGYEEWKKLSLSESTYDASTIEKFNSDLVPVFGKDKYGNENLLATRSAVAPVQLISGMGHLYIFRQSTDNRLLANRFILDGMKNELVPKLDVRFKRSRQKYEVSKSMKMGQDTDGSTALNNLDALDFKDMDGNPFYEPTWKLDFIENLHEGWFSAVLLPTIEHEKYRWTIFVYDSVIQKIISYTIRASQSGIFDLKDYPFLETDSKDTKTRTLRTIPGIIKRTLDIKTKDGNIALVPRNGLSASTYDLQEERVGDNGELQLFKNATRVMLAVPVTFNSSASAATVSFTVRSDGTLAPIDETPETRQLSAVTNELVLPLNMLNEVKEIIDRTPPASGVMNGVRESQDGTVTIIAKTLPDSLASGGIVKISGTKSYDGVHNVVQVIEEEDGSKSFEITASFANNEAGFWEVVPTKQSGLTFDNMIVEYKKTGNGLLKCTCRTHNLEVGDEVQVSGTQNYNGLYPVKAVNKNDSSFSIDINYPQGEIIDLKSKKRRGIRFNGGEDHLQTGNIILDRFAFDTNAGRTLSAWVWIDGRKNTPQLIVGQQDRSVELVIDARHYLTMNVLYSDSNVRSIANTNPLPLKTWVHCAGTIEYGIGEPKEVIVQVYVNGAMLRRFNTIRETQRETYRMAETPTAFKFGGYFWGGTPRRSDVRIPMVGMPRKALTMAFWVKTESSANGDLINYASHYTQNPWRNEISVSTREFSVTNPHDMQIYVGNEVANTNINVSDGEWHHLSVSWASENGVLAVYKDGEKAFSLHDFQKGYALSESISAILMFGTNGEAYFQGSLGELNVWSTELVKEEIKGLMRKPAAGTESHLVGSWIFRDGKAYDLSPGRRHGTIRHVRIETISEKIEPRPVRLFIGGTGADDESFNGKISDVQVWNICRDSRSIKAGMHTNIRGYEEHLSGQWRMGAIVIERGVRQIPDFSTQSNNAIVFGTPFVSERSFSRQNNENEKVVKYSSDEVVAVSQRARYRESFEFKLRGSAGNWELDKLNNADDRNNKVRAIQFCYWGKQSRSSEKKIPWTADVYTQNEFKPVGSTGWFQASCEFIVPDGITVVRAFEVAVNGLWTSEDVPPTAEWTTMEVRKHRIENISDAITCRSYTDSIDLVNIGGSTSGTTYSLLEDIRALELCEADLSRHLQNLALRLDINQFKEKYETELTAKEAERDALTTEISRLTERATFLATNIAKLAKKIPSRSHAFEKAINSTRLWRSKFRLDAERLTRLRGYGPRANYPYYNRRIQEARASQQYWTEKLEQMKVTRQQEIGRLQETKRDYERERDGIAKLKPANSKKLESVTDRVNILTRFLGRTKDTTAILTKYQTTTSKGMERVRTALTMKNTEFLQTYASSQQQPQAMEPIGIKKHGNKGALLGFVSPQSRLHASISARGNLELNYFDVYGRMQCTPYDVTADSRNATFEQWLPDTLHPAVEFCDFSDKMSFESNLCIDLQNKWTLEAWFQYPFVSKSPTETYGSQVLVEDVRGRQIVVKAGRYLGATAESTFFDTGIDFETSIGKGWHHLAVTADTDAGLSFYLNGEMSGTVPKKYTMSFGGEGINDCIKWNNFAGFPTSSMTISVWVKTFGRNAQPTILSYWTASGDTFHITDVNPVTVSINEQSTQTTINLNDGFWHHLAITWEPASGALKVYKNGILEESSINNGQKRAIVSTGTLVLGQMQSSKGGGFSDSKAFDGTVRGLSIWDIARAADEIKTDVYEAFKGDESYLVGYWPMETLDEDGKVKVRDHAVESPQHGEICGEPKAEIVTVMNGDSYQLKTIGNSADGGEPFGCLAEMRFWRQSLNVNEIAALARANSLAGNEPGLLAYYPMREAVGSKVRDYSAGEKVPAVLHGAAWKACTGEMNKPASASKRPDFSVLSLDGISDFVEIPGLAGELGGDEITIEYWFRGSAMTSAVRQQSIYAGGIFIIAPWSLGDNQGHYLSNDRGNPKFHTPMRHGDTENEEWQHVAMTWKRDTSDGFATYLNGEEVDKRNTSNSPLPSVNASLYLGSNLGQGDFTKGHLAEVRIWKVARTKEQIIANMHRRLSGHEPGLKAYYPLNVFSEIDGFIKVLDKTPNNYHGTVRGARLVNNDGLLVTNDKHGLSFTRENIPSDVLYFDGKTSWAHCDDIDLTNRSFTFECWVKNGQPEIQSFFVWHGISQPNDGLHIGFRGNNHMTFSYGGNRHDTELLQVDKDWHHFACTYDYTNRTAKSYLDGEEVGHSTFSSHFKGKGKFCLSAPPVAHTGGATIAKFKGCLDDVRLWSSALSKEQITMRKDKRLSGEEEDLIAYWPVVDVVNGTLKDKSAAAKYDISLHEVFVVEASSGLPFARVATDLERATISACEYATRGLDPDNPNRTINMLRSFRGYSSQSGDVEVLSEMRIEALELKWAGNARFKPTLLGYIEGAPPVPSENLTVDYDYNDATSVTLCESQDVSYTWSRTKETSQGLDLDLFLGVGWGLDGGVGLVSKLSEGQAGFKGSLNLGFVDSNSTSVASGSTVAFNDSLGLRGAQERRAEFPHLSKRYVPKNVGYALIVSGLADVFVTRLARSGRMISYEMRPVEGVPLDINTITFQINPTYTMNGSLDGLTGSQPSSSLYFQHVPEMREQYGSLYPASYYRLNEAYDLKEKIEQWDKDREAYFWNYDVTWIVNEPEIPSGDMDSYGQVSVNRDEDVGLGDGEDEEGISESEKQNRSISKVKNDMEEGRQQAKAKGEQRKGDIEKHFADAEKRERASAALSGWQSNMEKLLIRAGKRNIVNTYVWDTNGGFRAETQDFANTIEHTIGSDFTVGGTLGGAVDTLISAFKLELTALYAGELTQTSSKTENIGQTFNLDVDVGGVESRDVLDVFGKPYKPAEKVSRYRFMSFYLEGNSDNFHDFFDYVVDPDWLAGNSESARALRQAKTGKPNKAWRVLHRVTYVERPSLEGVGQDTRQRTVQEEDADASVSFFESLEKKNRVLKADLDKVLEALRVQGLKLNNLVDSSS